MGPTPHTLVGGRPLTGPPWSWTTPGSGRMESGNGVLRLINGVEAGNVYSNAQIDDTQGRRRAHFLWKPPLRLQVRARFSHPGVQESGEVSMQGTAGFGFWNDPFWMTERRLPALPRALWFFYAGANSDIRLARDVRGNGWKAATIDARTAAFLALLPAAPLALLLMRIPNLYHRLWPIGQRAIRVSERLVPGPMDRWRIYTLDWSRRWVRFWVDGRLLHESPYAIPGPLGFVLWIDNQFMRISPEGHFASGISARREEAWLAIEWLTIDPTT